MKLPKKFITRYNDLLKQGVDAEKAYFQTMVEYIIKLRKLKLGGE